MITCISFRVTHLLLSLSFTQSIHKSTYYLSFILPLVLYTMKIKTIMMYKPNESLYGKLYYRSIQQQSTSAMLSYIKLLYCNQGLTRSSLV